MPAKYRQRSAVSGDIDRLVRFNAEVFRPAVGEWARAMLTGNHPAVSVGEFSIVECVASGEIASSLCFINQTWFFGDVRLRVGQVELVGTAPSHRGEGLVRLQMEWFENSLKRHACHLACVQGVPSLYQRLGYQFAVPLKGGMRLACERIPHAEPRRSTTIRPASAADLSDLMRLYRDQATLVAIHSERDLALWRYQESQSPDAEHSYETVVLQDSGRIAGYMRVRSHPRAESLVVRELSAATYGEVLALLGWARERARVKQCSSLTLQLPASHPVINLAKYWGAEVLAPFAWQVRVVDWVSFLCQLSPLFDKRLATSLMSDYTGEVSILLGDLQTTLTLMLQTGKVTGLTQANGSPEWHLKATVPTLTMLALGYRSRVELEKWHLELQTRSDCAYIIDTLFPQSAGYVYEAY